VPWRLRLSGPPSQARCSAPPSPPPPPRSGVHHPNSLATTTASSSLLHAEGHDLNLRFLAIWPISGGARDVQRDATAMPPSAPAAVEQFQLRRHLCHRRVFDQKAQRRRGAAAARPGPAAMSVLRLQGRRRQRGGEGRRIVVGREQR
jgi:hypothetical protein